jgi:hypothetical protein
MIVIDGIDENGCWYCGCEDAPIPEPVRTYYCFDLGNDLGTTSLS